MARIEKFEDIEAWKKGRKLVNVIYDISNKEPFTHDYGLKDQIRRAAVSVISNIAEGFERDTNPDFRRFLAIAKGSVGEIEAQLYVALDQSYITQKQFDSITALASEIKKLISGFMIYLKQSDNKNRKSKTLPEK